MNIPDYPIKFIPRFKERIWGGQKLAELYQKQCSGSGPIGESWEVSDRPGDESVVENGPLAGKSIRWLIQNHGEAMFGRPTAPSERFPWLAKILDARQDLSLQVHPPAGIAPQLNGEPKTEAWYIADADPGAKLYVGLRKGVTREEFEKRIDSGDVAECFHQVPVEPGDVMFLPSGRVHALGAGIVLFEIQQNSDTTYRVFDWNRKGLDGKPRELHIPQSMASIDFDDFEPDLARAPFLPDGDGISKKLLVDHAVFRLTLLRLQDRATWKAPKGKMTLLAVVKGRCRAGEGGTALDLPTGSFVLIPAGCREAVIGAKGVSQLLAVEESI